MDLAKLPSWALDTMLICAQGADKLAMVREVEAARNERLFEDTQDSVWYADIPMYTRGQGRPMPEQRAWLPIPSDAIERVFGEKGELAKHFAHYEARVGQVAMAQAVAEALNTHRFLLAEAGTGVGKSLAYLVPSALWAYINNLPIVISTNTRNLQTQLISKDIPLVGRVLAPWYFPGRVFTAVTLKGRSNYLCLKRFGTILESGLQNLTPEQLLLFADLTAWLANSADGDMDAFRVHFGRDDIAFRRTLGCHAEGCTKKHCRHYKRCFLYRARQAAQDAHVIITNHALVFAELSGEAVLLPNHAQIVFDEAHNLENAATQFFSEELNVYVLYDICQKLAPSKGHEIYSITHRARVEFVDKAIQDNAEIARLTALLADLRSEGLQLANTGTQLFEALTAFTAKASDAVVRYRTVPDTSKPLLKSGLPQLRREVCLQGGLFTLAETILPETTIQGHADTIITSLTEIKKLLERLSLEILRRVPPSNDASPYADLEASITSVQEQLDFFGTLLTGLLSASRQDMVFWMEVRSEKERTVSLMAAPLDIAQKMRTVVYKGKASLILSSATLRTNENFEHIERQLGLAALPEAKEVSQFVAESPFDYPKQCVVAVPTYLPEVEDKNYTLELSRLMYQLFVAAKGRSLALFTSYEMMRTCEELIRPHLEERGIELLTQANASRDAITETFRANQKPTVLFGTQSFWEGVDVVGDALSCVVIARLPFESYGGPLFRARSERITEQGGVSFNQLSLPQAIIRFRQGFGRLIRSKQDAGIVVIADNRILRKGYGRLFAKALPCAIQSFGSRQACVAALMRLLKVRGKD